MNIKDVTLTKAGKPVTGEPEAGKYYRIKATKDSDPRTAALEMKKKYPKSFFAFRPHAADAAGTAEPTKAVPPVKK